MGFSRLLVVALTSSSFASALTTTTTTSRRAWTRLFSSTITDTPAILPDFETKEAYLEYMESVSALPKGFATGTAKGTFVSVEAPSMGDLPIRGTVIHLTEGSTENWAAVYTKNKVITKIEKT
jgi:hypothetical protein